MGKTSKSTAPQVESLDGYEGRFDAIDDYTIAFETHSADADLSALFKGLPDDMCQCPHWGLVTKGTMTFTYADGSTDVVNAGEAYYARPGHLPTLTDGTELVEFSPTEALNRTMETVMKNVAAMSS